VTRTTTAGLRRTRFAQIPEWVIAHPIMLEHPTALAVYAHLFLLADYKSRRVTTSDWREITGVTGWSKATVMRAMKCLRDAGAVMRDGADLVLPMDQLVGRKYDTQGREPSVKNETQARQIRDHADSDLRPALFSTEFDSEVLHIPAQAPVVRVTFEDFWENVWRKANPTEARRAWDKATKTTDPAVILEATRRMTAWPHLPAKEHLPHPATWLNNRRWENDLAETYPAPTNGNGHRDPLRHGGPSLRDLSADARREQDLERHGR
jgi:hypothetical protein